MRLLNLSWDNKLSSLQNSELQAVYENQLESVNSLTTYC